MQLEPSMRRGHIAILGTRGVPAQYGGFETFAEALAIGLVQRGYRVTVYCERGQREAPNEYRGVELKYITAPKVGALSTIFFDLFCLVDSCRRYDIVYMLGYGSAPFCLLPRLFGRRVWINMDGVEWRRSKWSTLGRTYLRVMESIAVQVAHRVIADADGIRGHLVARHGELAKCVVIPYGADVLRHECGTVILEALGLSKWTYYLVVCRLEPENHVLEILEGFLKSQSQIPLVVVGGTGGTSDYVRHLLGLAGDRIRFVGAIYDQEALSSLRFYCRAYFHGHSVGGTNPSLLEAMGAGNVVVAHDNVFNREVLGGRGYYFSAPTDIADAVSGLEQCTEEELASIRNSSRERVQSSYSWASVIDRYEHLLRQEASSQE